MKARSIRYSLFPEVVSEINRCLKKLKDTIELNPNKGLIDNEFTRSVKSKIGFDPIDLYQSQEIFSEYMKRKIFPNSIKCDSVYQFLKILEMDEMITKAAISYKAAMDKEIIPSVTIEKPALVGNSAQKSRIL